MGTLAGVITGNPGPKYILEINYGGPDRKVIAMSRGELDVYYDSDFEAFQHARHGPGCSFMVCGLPLSTRQTIFNFASETQWLREKDVRWALTLALNIQAVVTDYLGGTAKLTNIPVPSTPALTAIYHDPMEEWFQNLEIEIEEGVMYKPYDANIAARAEAEGKFRVMCALYSVPVGGHAPDVADRLLMKHQPDGGNLTPDGNLGTRILTDTTSVQRSIGNAVADMLTSALGGARTHTIRRREMTTDWFSFVLARRRLARVQQVHPDLVVPIGEDARLAIRCA